MHQDDDADLEGYFEVETHHAGARPVRDAQRNSGTVVEDRYLKLLMLGIMFNFLWASCKYLVPLSSFRLRLAGSRTATVSLFR